MSAITKVTAWPGDLGRNDWRMSFEALPIKTVCDSANVMLYGARVFHSRRELRNGWKSLAVND